ncbi:hypothetical protein [uncultured Thiodictyon sp.]|uniref:hypothetical protein n=1 Tax=uncultured Thiodictyon sp. TaxID=1846217 RepID=UPI0025EC188C|nr:hypothetical protein [uncultured Thiodictyon sp.]
MNPKTLTRATTATLLLAIGLTAAAEQVLINDNDGINVDVRGVIDQAPQGGGPAIGADVQDMSDGTTNEGGPVEGYADLRDAALRDEKNLGPNAPGYIP